MLDNIQVFKNIFKNIEFAFLKLFEVFSRFMMHKFFCIEEEHVMVQVSNSPNSEYSQ